MVEMAEKKPAGKQPKSQKPPKRKRDVLFISLDSETEACLVAFIASQVVEPDRSAVGLKALREFLGKQGYWPPKPGK